MPDLTLSVLVTRTELTLGDLELNDHSAFVTVGFGPGAPSNRNSYNRSGNVKGGTLNNSVPDITIRPLIVRAIASSQSQLNTRISLLVATFSQSSYQIKETIAGQLTTYDCMPFEQISPADPAGVTQDETDLMQLLAFQHVYRLTIPTQPTPLTGPI